VFETHQLDELLNVPIWARRPTQDEFATLIDTLDDQFKRKLIVALRNQVCDQGKQRPPVHAGGFLFWQKEKPRPGGWRPNGALAGTFSLQQNDARQ